MTKQAASQTRTLDNHTYWPQLDGLRTLAVAAVLAIHATYGFVRGGYLGVDLFFALSGFLITSLLANEIERNGRVQFKLFYIRRFLRLYPALFVMVAATGLVWKLAPRANVSYFRMALAALFYHANFFPLGNPLSHTWSLSTEEQYYIVWPLFLSLIWSPRLRRWFLVPTLAIILGAIGVRKYMLLHHYTDLQIYLFPFARMDSLVTGATAALALRKEAVIRLAERSQRALKFTGFAALAIFVYFVCRVSRVWLELWGYTVVALVCSALVASVVLVGPAASALNRMLSSRPMVYFGRRSYGIYLYHFPVFDICERLRVQHSTANYIGVTFLRFTLAIGIALLSYEFIEKRFLRLKDRFEPRAAG